MSSDGLTPVEAHLADILAMITPLPPTRLELSQVEGLVLADDITAMQPLPPFDNSSMDGYAVHVDDVTSAGKEHPVTLPVVGEIAAGDTGAYALPAHSAIRIMTGAMMPNGADAVIPVEWTDGGLSRVEITASAPAGHAIRLAGDDAAAGATLVTRGTRLKPMHIAAIAGAGHGSVPVRPRPRVVVLATGNELAEPGTPLVPGRIWESNSYMIAAAAREAGCLAYRQSGIPDQPEAVLQTIEDQLVRADLLVTTGGVSMGGEHDVVKAALHRLGTITFRKVAMQPGMPQGFGVVGEDRIPIITLPGNPVSAYVSFQLFVRPALGALQDYPGLGLPVAKATLTEPVRSPAGRRSYLRGVLTGDTVTPLTGQGSHQIATLSRANALIAIPEWVVQQKAGDTTDVLVLPLRLRPAPSDSRPRPPSAAPRPPSAARGRHPRPPSAIRRPRPPSEGHFGHTTQKVRQRGALRFPGVLGVVGPRSTLRITATLHDLGPNRTPAQGSPNPKFPTNNSDESRFHGS